MNMQLSSSMSNSELCRISPILRKRWQLAARAACESLSVYDEAFWGTPWEWDSVGVDQHTIADLLFPLAETELVGNSHEQQYSQTCLYADWVDGYLTLHRHGVYKNAQWEPFIEKWLRFNRSSFEPKIRTYQGNEESAKWCIAADTEAEVIGLKSCLRRASLCEKRRFPDMDGVMIHVDLTWAALRVAYVLSDESSPRIVELPLWGWRSWLSHAAENEPLLLADFSYIEKMMVENQSSMFFKDNVRYTLLPSALKCTEYIQLLLNLLPYQEEASVRITGWLTTKVFSSAITEHMHARFASIINTSSYQAYSF